jgi:fido (protein-threonine AMPylation protein)
MVEEEMAGNHRKVQEEGALVSMEQTDMVVEVVEQLVAVVQLHPSLEALVGQALL